MRILKLALIAACAFTVTGTTHAQTYPTKPVRLLVPFAPGGGADITGRAIAQKLAEGLGQQVVVDNRAGAASNIGTELAARSAPDGYTLLLIGPNHTTNVSLFAKLNYDPIKDFEPTSLVTSAPYVLLVHPSMPVRNVKELIARPRQTGTAQLRLVRQRHRGPPRDGIGQDPG